MARLEHERGARRDSWALLEREAEACRACPRLVRWREQVAREKRRGHADCDYWGKPVPSFGPRDARILVLGLAPGAHGANRTGRPFTGDGAGPFLYGALHEAGLCSAPVSTDRGDGLELWGARISNAVRCVPPGNHPAPPEIRRCASFLAREVALMRELRAVLCLGAIAWRAAHAVLAEREHGPRVRCEEFAHASVQRVAGIWMVGSYHPSQLNTRTGRLTEAMFERALRKAVSLADGG